MTIARLMSLLTVGTFLSIQLLGTAGYAQVDNPERYRNDSNTYQAYKAAESYPEVFKAVFCYCGCDKDGAHTSLFDCFRNSHGSGCGICKSEALMAARLKSSGAAIGSIQKSIDSSFASGYKGAPSSAYQAYRSRAKSNWM